MLEGTDIPTLGLAGLEVLLRMHRDGQPEGPGFLEMAYHHLCAHTGQKAAALLGFIWY